MIQINRNTWPLPNMKEIPAVDFWHHVSTWGCPKSEYVGAKKDEEAGGWFTPIVFPINQGALIGGGFAVQVHYSGPKAGTQKFFIWRECDHEFEEKSGGNCYHIHICIKCGARFDVDSSD